MKKKPTILGQNNQSLRINYSHRPLPEPPACPRGAGDSVQTPAAADCRAETVNDGLEEVPGPAGDGEVEGARSVRETVFKSDLSVVTGYQGDCSSGQLMRTADLGLAAPDPNRGDESDK